MTKKREIRLGKLQLAIMKAVWDVGKATVRDVQITLRPRYPRAYSTILTMMRKLEFKGYLAHKVDERTFVYRPTITRAQVRKSLLAELVDQVFDGSIPLVVCGLIDRKPLSEKELAEIRKLIAEHSD